MKRKKPKYCAFSENKSPKLKDMMAKISPKHAHVPLLAHRWSNAMRMTSHKFTKATNISHDFIESRKQKAESRKQKAESRKQKAESIKPR